MADDKTLTVRVAVDNSDFAPGLSKATADMQRFADKTHAQSKSIGDAFKNVGSQGAGVLSALTTSGPLAALAQSQGVLAGIGSSVASAFGPVGTAVAGLTAGLAGLVALAKSVEAEFNKINRTARTLGETTANTQVLLRGFERGGLDPDSAQSALLKFSSHVGELRNNPGAPIGGALARIGLDPDKIAAAPLRTAIEETFEALSKMGNGFDRNRASQEIFGKSYIELAAVIARGRQTFRDAARDVELYGPSADALKEAANNAAARKRAELANPSITRVVEANFKEIAPTVSGFVDRLFNETLGGALTADIRRQTVTQRVNPAYVTGFGGAPLDPAAAVNPFAITEAELATRRMAEETADMLADWDEMYDRIGLSVREIRQLDLRQAGLGVEAEQERIYHLVNDMAVEERHNREQAAELHYTWQQLEHTIGLTARQAQIFRLEQQQLFAEAERAAAQDRVLTRLETELSLRRSVTAQIVAQRDGSLAISGITQGSTEAARIIADVTTRQNNDVGATPNEQQQQEMLRAIEAGIREGIRVQELTNRLLQRLGPIGQISGGI